MVSVADSPLTRRDVRRFLTWLVGFLIVLILTLLLFLRYPEQLRPGWIRRLDGAAEVVAHEEEHEGSNE